MRYNIDYFFERLNKKVFFALFGKSGNFMPFQASFALKRRYTRYPSTDVSGTVRETG